jgi:hypothetical protein
VNWFSDRDDARAYMTEILRIWIMWVIGLAALLFVSGWSVLLAGVVVLGVLVWLVQPIQRRASGIDDPGEFVEGSGGRFGGKRTRSETAMRVLLYGEPPIREAIESYGAWPGWLWVRRVVIAVTVVAFAVVFFDVFRGPQP